MSLPLFATGYTGALSGLLFVYIVIGILLSAGVTSFAINCYLLFSRRQPKKKWPASAALAYTVVVGSGLTLGGFIFHQNAPYDKNWYFLAGAILIVTTGIVGAFRWWRKTAQDEPPLQALISLLTSTFFILVPLVLVIWIAYSLIFM